ncbi:MAG: nickel-dependent lactate racemase [Pyrinomonadaceae bacterium]|nr:nickel-dependent lactate racemase [Pyrinomonadaceae bacterium]
MPTIALKYGKTVIPFDFDETQFDVLGKFHESAPLSDVELGARFDAPIDSKLLEDIVQPDETVLIVVPDATRQTACGQIVNLLVRRLIANGTMPFEINIIFATGIHRRVTEDEKREILTPFIVQRIKTLEHNAKDWMSLAGLDSDRFVNFGEINGAPVELNKVLTEYDHVILVGGVSFHYFAGFTGGRKLICPGLASEKTIAATHKLAFDCETKTRREGVGTAKLKGNAVHEAFVAVAQNIKPSFAFNAVVNEKGEAVELFCGDWLASHETACEFYAEQNTVEINEKRDVVIVSCGGFPHDVNLVQAHKALESAAQACKDGGQIILLAECADGLGRNDFLKWFESENSQRLAEILCENYEVNGQTAWSLLRKTENFDVRVVTSLSNEETRRMRMNPARKLAEIVIDKNARGYILPFGAKVYIKF